MRATVLGHTWMSRAASSCAIFSVVRRVQRNTGDGLASDIVLECRFDGGDHLGRFFFPRVAPATGAADPGAPDVAGDQLRASSGHGTDIDAEQRRDAPVAAPAALERFEAGVQAALTFIKQAGEQHDRGAQFVGHELGIRHRSGQPGGGQQSAPALSCCALRVRSAAQYKKRRARLWRVSLPSRTSVRRASWVPTCSRLSNSSLNCPAGAAATIAAAVASRVPALEKRTSRNDHSPCSSKSTRSAKV